MRHGSLSSGSSATVHRLQNVSTTRVDSCGQPRTREHEVNDSNWLSSERLGPKVARHQPVRKTRSIGFESRRPRQLKSISNLHTPAKSKTSGLKGRRP